MWVVNKRYLNDENFKPKRKILQPFTPSLADSQILQDTDPNYRVYNTTRVEVTGSNPRRK